MVAFVAALTRVLAAAVVALVANLSPSLSCGTRTFACPPVGSPLAPAAIAARIGPLGAAFPDLFSARGSTKEKKRRPRPRRKDAMSPSLSPGWSCASLAFLLVARGFTDATGQTLSFARDDYSSTAGARGIATADFDRNGWADMAQANLGRNTITILLNHPGARFDTATEVPCWPLSVSAIDAALAAHSAKVCAILTPTHHGTDRHRECRQVLLGEARTDYLPRLLHRAGPLWQWGRMRHGWHVRRVGVQRRHRGEDVRLKPQPRPEQHAQGQGDQREPSVFPTLRPSLYVLSSQSSPSSGCHPSSDRSAVSGSESCCGMT